MRKCLCGISKGLMVIATTVLLSACGEGSETNPPAVALTASTLTSQSTSGHTHLVVIPFTDVSGAVASTDFQYRTSDTNGHSHVIALSPQQMIDLNNGMVLTVTSSTPNNGVATHTHIWNLQGGSVLYEKFCYNCHSNDKRNQAPASNAKMGTSFNWIGNQLNNLINPAGASLSISTAAIPDPNFQPVTTVDGVALYAGACATCHGPLASSTKSNRTAAQISAAIVNQNQMNGLSTLTPAQIQAIATALIK